MISPEEARMWGRIAWDMGLTLQHAIDDIVECGCPHYLVPQIQATYTDAKFRSLFQETYS